MHLTEESTLIDAGIDVNLGYNGAAPDLGCFESPGEHHDPIPDDTIPDVQPEGTHAIAYVSIPNATEDKSLLASLRQNDSLWIVVATKLLSLAASLTVPQQDSQHSKAITSRSYYSNLFCLRTPFGTGEMPSTHRISLSLSQRRSTRYFAVSR